MSRGLNNQYYPDLSRSRYSTRTSRRLKSTNRFDDAAQTQSPFARRIEKACTTTSAKDLSKELTLCRREIERLQKQSLKKDKTIIEIRSASMLNKELEAELVETYRIIYMYEGKITEYERELKRLEETIASKMGPQLQGKVEELLESYRVENAQLMGRMEEKERLILELENKLKTTEAKYFTTSWKLSSTKRQVANPLKQRFPKLRNTITINETPLQQKEKALRKGMASTQPAQDFYQPQETAKPNERSRELIRFNRVQNRGENKVERVEPRLATPTHHRLQVSNQPPIKQVHTEYGSAKWASQSLNSTPITQRKVYTSAINRFQLNRPSLTSNSQTALYTRRVSPQPGTTVQQAIYLH